MRWRLPDRKQRDAYARIAGDPDKVVAMGPSDCGCSGDPQEEPDSSSTSAASQLAKLLSQGLNGYLHGGTPPPPIPVPVP